MKRQDDRWVDVPFWFATLVWAWMLIFPAFVLANWLGGLYHLGTASFVILGLLIALVNGMIAAAVSRRLHGGS